MDLKKICAQAKAFLKKNVSKVTFDYTIKEKAIFIASNDVSIKGIDRGVDLLMVFGANERFIFSCCVPYVKETLTSHKLIDKLNESVVDFKFYFYNGNLTIMANPWYFKEDNCNMFIDYYLDKLLEFFQKEDINSLLR